MPKIVLPDSEPYRLFLGCINRAVSFPRKLPNIIRCAQARVSRDEHAAGNAEEVLNALTDLNAATQAFLQCAEVFIDAASDLTAQRQPTGSRQDVGAEAAHSMRPPSALPRSAEIARSNRDSGPGAPGTEFDEIKMLPAVYDLLRQLAHASAEVVDGPQT